MCSIARSYTKVTARNCVRPLQRWHSAHGIREIPIGIPNALFDFFFECVQALIRLVQNAELGSTAQRRLFVQFSHCRKAMKLLALRIQRVDALANTCRRIELVETQLLEVIQVIVRFRVTVDKAHLSFLLETVTSCRLLPYTSAVYPGLLILNKEGLRSELEQLGVCKHACTRWLQVIFVEELESSELNWRTRDKCLIGI